MAGLWGNHEGSLLLWVTHPGIYGGAVAAFGDNLPARLQARVLAVQATIALGFLASCCHLQPFPGASIPAHPTAPSSIPFFRTRPRSPPTLYLGYVGLSMAFSFAVLP